MTDRPESSTGNWSASPLPARSGLADKLACVVLAHNDPAQVRRLIDALDPFPVFLHCDRRSKDDVFAAMTHRLPDRCFVLPRLPTPWAGWNAAAAEISGYRAALAQTGATHLAMMSGSDYPLASTSRIGEYLDSRQGHSIALFDRLPRAPWGRDGGMSRIRYWHRPIRRFPLRVPIPRRIPADIVPAGGSVLKVLSRQHAQQVVDTYDARPDLVAFWRHTLCADETFVASILNTPEFAPDWGKTHIDADLWYIEWLSEGRKSPEWMTTAHLATLRDRSLGKGGEPALFARKFSSSMSAEVLDAIDVTLRRTGAKSA